MIFLDLYFIFVRSYSQCLVKSLITPLVIISSVNPIPFSLSVFTFSFLFCLSLQPLNYSKYPLLKYRFLQKRRRNERFKGYPRKRGLSNGECSCELFESGVFFPQEAGLDFHENRKEKCHFKRTWFLRSKPSKFLSCRVDTPSFTNERNSYLISVLSICQL